MRRGYRNALRLVVLTVGAILAVLVAWPHEPRYQGKRLGQWLADLEFDGAADSGARARAMDAVRAIGTNALPRLTQMLCAEDSALRKALIHLSARSSVIRFQINSSRRIQDRGLHGYQALGSAATIYLPVLIRIMDDPSSPPQSRAYVALALGQMGRDARTAIPALAKAARDQDQEVRLNAMLALANIHQWDHNY